MAGVYNESEAYFPVCVPAKGSHQADAPQQTPSSILGHELLLAQPRRLLKRPLEVTEQPLSAGLKGTLVRLGGHLEDSRVQWLEQLFVTILSNGCERCIVDVMRLKGIDRAGVECIARVVAHFQRCGAALSFTAAPSTVGAALKPVGLCKTIPYYATIEQALEKLSHPEATVPPVMLAQTIAPVSTYDTPEGELEKHIKAIIADFGPVSASKMVRLLRMQDYGAHALSVLSLLHVLNRIDLNTRSKQERFHRSW